VLRSKIYGGKQYGINIDSANGRFDNVQIYNHSSHGVCVRNGSNPNFTNSRIYECGKENSGAVCVMSGAKGTFRDCQVYNNRSYGYQITGDNTDPRVENGSVRNNKTDGIYVYSNARGRFDVVTVETNATGYRVVSGANPTVNGGRVSGTTGMAAIAVLGKGRGTFDRVAVTNNNRRGIDVRTGGAPNINNCIITNNGETGITASRNGDNPGSNDVAGTPTVKGCTIHTNRGGGIVVWNGGAGRYHITNDVTRNGGRGNVSGTSLTNF
jgi:hypothetical protein